MTPIARFRSQIDKELMRQKLTRSELARRIGVSPPLVTRWLESDGNMTFSTMTRLAAALGKRVSVELVERKRP